jgi:hypothetical protein
VVRYTYIGVVHFVVHCVVSVPGAGRFVTSVTRVNPGLLMWFSLTDTASRRVSALGLSRVSTIDITWRGWSILGSV